MLAGSLAVEGQGRGLSQAFPGAPPMAEFVRPLPRAPPFSRYAPAPPAPHEDAPSASPAYPPVPGAYARFLTHPPTFQPYAYPGYAPHHHHQQQQQQQQQPQHHPPHHQQPLPAPAPLPPPALSPPSSRSAPRGHEGSRKHRLLSRERAPAPARFSRGALIQLAAGELRRVEDMRTEDFVHSAEQNPELRLTHSTVTRLLRRPATDTVTLTLSYNNDRTQVDIESPVEHPFFVFNVGWASCSPERTMACYGLQVKRLQLGDLCVSLVHRESPIVPPSSSAAQIFHHQSHQNSATIVTTATTTAMTVRPTEAPQKYPENLSLREDSRKRRSSAPDICGDENPQRPRIMRH